MIIDFEPGDKVINPNRKDWGIGQVQSIINDKITINFENVGKKVIYSKNMDLKKINEQLKPQLKPLTKIYGTMGICLGEELKKRLKTYCEKNDLKMSQIIKVLIKNYLDEMEE